MTMEHEISEPKSFISRYIFSTDHKVIAVQFIITGLIWAIVGGLLGLFFRYELTWPETGILNPEAYNASVTLHGAIMVFWVAMPILIGGFANLCIPLMIGAKDMAFPRLNMLSYWVFFLSSLVLALSFFVTGGPASYGWTIYPPLSSDPRFTGAYLGGVLLILALAFEFVSMLMGGINYITTTINLRTKGMSMMRLPIIVWTEIIASVLFLLSVTPLIAGAVLLLLDILVGTHFFRVTAEGQGDPVLWQHLFWFFGHPEVYVVLLPAFGIIIEVFTSHSRKPVFGYKSIVYSSVVAGIISFVVWAHHMFVAGINPFLAFPFAILTIVISVPFAIMLICFSLTLWGGSIRFTAANLFAIEAFVAFIIGGLTGLFLGGQSTDIYFHDTYFVVAHFHYTLFPTAILA
ncbi:MAG: cbb3-type cytochrome c oxidase subunit I, partial [Thermodesulfobacteriota bacterium]